MIYFAQPEDGGLIKIGSSIRIAERMYNLSRMTNVPIKVLGVMEGSFKREYQLHKKFVRIRVVGEWFKESAELLTFIAQEATPFSGELRMPYEGVKGWPPRYGDWPTEPLSGEDPECIEIASLRCARRKAPTIWEGETDQGLPFRVHYDHRLATIVVGVEVIYQEDLFGKLMDEQKELRILLRSRLKPLLCQCAYTKFKVPATLRGPRYHVDRTRAYQEAVAKRLEAEKMKQRERDHREYERLKAIFDPPPKR